MLEKQQLCSPFFAFYFPDWIWKDCICFLSHQSTLWACVQLIVHLDPLVLPCIIAASNFVSCKEPGCLSDAFFAQVSSHLTEVSGYCCLFTQLRSSCKFDQAIIRIRCSHNAYKLLATSTKCHSHSSPQWQIWISFCHKIPLMQFTKWILCRWGPFSHPFKLIWDKHKAWVTYDFMGQTH